jgi:hypothetical protein
MLRRGPAMLHGGTRAAAPKRGSYDCGVRLRRRLGKMPAAITACRSAPVATRPFLTGVSIWGILDQTNMTTVNFWLNCLLVQQEQVRPRVVPIAYYLLPVS